MYGYAVDIYSDFIVNSCEKPTKHCGVFEYPPIESDNTLVLKNNRVAVRKYLLRGCIKIVSNTIIFRPNLL